MSNEYNIIPQFPEYAISTEMEVIDIETDKRLTWYPTSGTPYVILYKYDNIKVLVSILYVLTYIGYSPFEIIRDKKNYTYKVPSECIRLNEDEYFLDGEYFKRIPGFSQYLISMNGVIYNQRRCKFMVRTYKDDGTILLSLTDDNGNRTPRRLHKLAYVTFIGPIPPNISIKHIDGNEWNNKPSNLKAVEANNLALLNEPDIFSNPPERKSDEEYMNHQYKFTPQDILNIRKRVSEGEKPKELAKEYNCAKNIIERIRDRKIWKNV